MREGPLAEINSSSELEAWLQTQPREVAVALAARVALRILPHLQDARRRGFKRIFFADIVLSGFRTTGVVWATAKYPAQAKKLEAYAGAAFAAARAATRAADDVAAAAIFASARAATRAAAAADAANAAALAADATGVESAAYGAFWSAVSIDATRVEEGTAASDIAGSPLWPQGQPDRLRSLWQEMKAALLAAKQDWEVWTDWYDDRLEGRVRDEKRELAYVRIEKALWDQGPAIVNAEIVLRVPELKALDRQAVESIPEQVHISEELIGVVVHSSAPVAETPPTLPASLENVPSPVSFGWSSQGTVTVILGELNWPAFPFKGSEQDYKHRLEVCRALAIDIARSLQRQKWNARLDYAETLDQYVAYLPKHSEEGNFLLADAQARVIRAMFAAEVDILQVALAAKLQVLLQQHIGLRAYYPTTEDFYESVRTGHLETPLPLDAVEGFLLSVLWI